MKHQYIFRLSLSLAVTILLCCTILPFLIPPYELNSISDVLEVLLWQGIATIGWPFALLGMALSLPFGARLTSATPLLLMLIYPVIQSLLIWSIISITPRRLVFILLHIFIILSFTVVWYYVQNGYDFMFG